MKPSVAAEIARLGQLTVSQLTRRYEEVAGEPCRSRHKQYLVRRVAWLLQAKAEGGLTERARRRAEELANVADVRVTPPRAPRVGATVAKPARIVADHDPRLPPPGNWVERPYKGRLVRVLVLADGFEFEGERYRSLSAIAKAVTGSHVNGFHFFRLGGQL
jgi:hypothetical protein